MANKLQIRGVIVGSEFDSAWAQTYIDKGIITPESRFRSALNACDPMQPLDVYVNSPGGSVFAGNEMANALIDWKRTTGQKVNVTIGAMAASMGAVLPVQAADTVSAYPNSKIMFHGASSVSVGGEAAMKDTAELLGKINQDIKTALVSRYGANPDEVAQWFAEGREKWLTAAEAKKLGMVTNIIDGKAEPMKATASDVKALGAKGIGISAIVDLVEIEVEPSTAPEAQNNEHTPAPAGELTTPEASAAGGTSVEHAPAAPDGYEQQLQNRENIIAELRGQLASITAENTGLKSQVEALRLDLVGEQNKFKASEATVANLKQRLEKMFGGIKYEAENAGSEDWPTLVNRLGYAEARKQHPAVYATYMRRIAPHTKPLT